jgi:hypothetical protein
MKELFNNKAIQKASCATLLVLGGLGFLSSAFLTVSGNPAMAGAMISSAAMFGLGCVATKKLGEPETP